MRAGRKSQTEYWLETDNRVGSFPARTDLSLFGVRSRTEGYGMIRKQRSERSTKQMQSSQKPFELSLAYPQWQGSGRHENLARGAVAAATVCEQYAPQIQVPLSDSTENAHGVRRWEAIFAQF